MIEVGDIIVPKNKTIAEKDYGVKYKVVEIDPKKAYAKLEAIGDLEGLKDFIERDIKTLMEEYYPDEMDEFEHAVEVASEDYPPFLVTITPEKVTVHKVIEHQYFFENEWEIVEKNGEKEEEAGFKPGDIIAPVEPDAYEEAYNVKYKVIHHDPKAKVIVVIPIVEPTKLVEIMTEISNDFYKNIEVPPFIETTLTVKPKDTVTFVGLDEEDFYVIAHEHLDREEKELLEKIMERMKANE